MNYVMPICSQHRIKLLCDIQCFKHADGKQAIAVPHKISQRFAPSLH